MNLEFISYQKHLVYTFNEIDPNKIINLELTNIGVFSFLIKNLEPLQLIEKKDEHILPYILKKCTDIYKFNLLPKIIIYKNAEGLKVYYLETKTYFIILSFGEIQPNYYHIYFEGIFLK
jgi:hypothetical protein